MRIEGQPPAQRASPRTGGAKRAGFSELVGTTRAAAAAMTAPIGLVGGVFAFDDDSDAASGRSRGLAAGHDLLDELEDLRRSLLLGSVGGGRLTQIADKLGRLPRAADPALSAIVDEIRLRVAVEIAKVSSAHIAACRVLARTV